MNFMKEKFKKIWEMAIPFQDKRDDNGHAEIVTNYAIQLCKLEKIKDDIVVPAAILHDIGWSCLTKKERFLIFDPCLTPEAERKIRIKHEEKSAKLAKKILNQVKYPLDLMGNIVEIISKHDTRKNFLSKEDGLVRDADKLWMYTKIGLEADIRRRGLTFDELYNYLKKQIDKKYFFYSESAKKIARKEFEDRKKEFAK